MTDTPPVKKRTVGSVRLRFRAFRRLLVRNEIFFKTVAATLLAAASVSIGWRQSTLSEKQLIAANQQHDAALEQQKLAALQSEIAIAQAMPSFDIKYTQKLNTATQFYEDDDITVENNGGPVHQFQASVLFIVDLAAGLPPIKLKLSVFDYFFVASLTGARKGLLVTFSGKKNNLSYVTFFRDLLKQPGDVGDRKYVAGSPKILLHLRYLDLIERHHDDYFEVSPTTGSRASNLSTFEEAETRRSISLRDLTVEKIVPQLDALIKQLRD
jgi:hypothetical protein